MRSFCFHHFVNVVRIKFVFALFGAILTYRVLNFIYILIVGATPVLSIPLNSVELFFGANSP